MSPRPVFQAQSDPDAPLPTQETSRATTRLREIWTELEELAARHRLPATPALDAGIATAVHRWAAGETLGVVLRGQDLTAGDFVRRCKMIVDLLGQVATAATDPVVRSKARAAMDLVLRGVVSADRLD